MKYERAKAEIISFDGSFMTASDTPIGNFTCTDYKIGEHCGYVTFASGIICNGFNNLSKSCNIYTDIQGKVHSNYQGFKCKNF